jgi:hypothetical protein
MQLHNSCLIRQSFVLVFNSSKKIFVLCILLLLSLDLLLVIVYHAIILF